MRPVLTRSASLLGLVLLVASGCNDSRVATPTDDALNVGGGSGADVTSGDDATGVDVGDDEDTGSDDAIEVPDIGDPGMDTSDATDDVDFQDGSGSVDAECGDGITEGDEECDDGEDNAEEPGACRPDCTLPTCGDGIVDDDESCDDGNDNDSDACSNACEPVLAALCAPCSDDTDCGRDQDVCLEIDSGSFCGVACEEAGDCPFGFTCGDVGQCIPESGVCEPCFDPDDDEHGIGPECVGFDCDESDDEINASATEVCDGADNDCSGTIDDDPSDGGTFYRDSDQDGVGDSDDFIVACSASEDYPVSTGGDCNDSDERVSPEADEVCDGIDNDCDPDTRDGVDDEAEDEACDSDDDDLCALGRFTCTAGSLVCNEDTADTTEICDGEDNDCNPTTPDGSQDPLLGGGCDGPDDDVCEGGSYICAAGDLVCDGDEGAGLEICDGIDNDCNGEIDDDPSDPSDWYLDRDGDEIGGGEPVNGCAPAPVDGGDWVLEGGDCDDDDPATFPGADEICDGEDNNCVGGVDEDPVDGDPAFVDGDRDGFGDPDRPVNVCELEVGFSDNGDDCNDEGRRVNPDADEVCDDGIDNDCNEDIDCLDAACADAEACEELLCPTGDIGSAVGDNVARGTTVGAGADFDASCGGGGSTDFERGGVLAEEVAISWTAPRNGRYTFDLVDSDYDTLLYILDACPADGGEEVVCNDDAYGRNTPSRLTVDAESGETAILVIDGWNDSVGEWQLDVSASEEGWCDDDVDNDQNGDIDCADDACAFLPVCDEVCDNEEDDDADGRVDCDDTNCELFPDCCPDDVFEPNEGNSGAPSTTFAQYSANPDALLTSRTDNLDSFRIPLCDTVTIRARARFTHDEGNIDMRLVVNTPVGLLPLANAGSNTDGESITWSASSLPDFVPVPDFAFLQVFMDEADRCSEYRLTIEVSGC